jgi:hypothetical protein
MFFRIDLLSQAGVRGDAAAFFQPASLKRRFVLMFFPAMLTPPSFALLCHPTRAIMARMAKSIQGIGLKNQQKSQVFEGCRSKMIKNDTVDTACIGENQIPWPQEDRIRWVEWRIRELTIESGEYVDQRGRWLLEEKGAGGRKLAPGDEVADYAVWLLNERDELSWHQIAYRFFPSATEEDIEKYESRVRRTFDRVERNHPGSKKYVPQRLSKDEKLLLRAAMLGVIPVSMSVSPESDFQA